MEQAAPQAEAVTAPTSKYKEGAKIKHIESGNEYFIHITPAHHVRLEGTNEPAYGYAAVGVEVGAESPVWFRSQAEIEDEARFEFIPQVADPRQSPEFLEAEKADFDRFYHEFQAKITEIWGTPEVGFDQEVAKKHLVETFAAYAEEKYGETHEINLLEVWVVDHMGKGGLPIAIADHTTGFLHDISTLFDYPPVAGDRPQMLHVKEAVIEDHHVNGADNHIKISLVRPSNGQADRPDSHDFYLLKGFTTQALGGTSPQTGLLIQFQDGPIREVGQTGVTIESLLAVAKHRLNHFNQGAMHHEQNDAALEALDTALNALKARTVERLETDKLDTPQP